MSLVFVDVYIDERGPDTLPAIGKVTFSLSNALQDPTGHVVYNEKPIEVVLQGGQGVVHLVANDNTGVVPQPTSYLVKLEIDGIKEPKYRRIVVPKAAPGGIAYLANLSPPPGTAPIYAYALETDLLALQALVGSLLITGGAAGVLNIADFGGDPTGATLSDSAYLAARDELVAMGGGGLVFPPGSWVMGDPQGSQHGMCPPRSNILLFGYGEASAVRFDDGLNDGSGHWANMFTSKEATDVVNNFHVRDLPIDYNGAHNLIPDPAPIPTGTGDTSIKYNYGVGVFNGDNLSCEGVTHLNNPGKTSVLFGRNLSPRTVKRAWTRNNYFHNFGTGVSGNTHSVDHSAVYAAAEDFTSVGDQFANDTTRAVGTAIELHCDRAVITAPTGSNIQRAFNFGAQFDDSDAVTVKGAAFTGIQYAGGFYVDTGRTMKRVEVDGTFVQDDGAHSAFDLYVNVLGKIEEVVLKGHLGYSGAATTDAEPAVIASPLTRYLDIELLCSDLLGGSLAVFDPPGGADTPDGDMVINLDGLRVLDCGRTSNTSVAAYKFANRIYVTTPGMIAALSMKGATYKNTLFGAGDITQFIDCITAIPFIEIIDPTVEGLPFPQWTMNQTPASNDYIMVRAALDVGGGVPNGQAMLCSIGSEMRDTSSSTGKVHRKRSANNAIGGWNAFDLDSSAPSGGSPSVGDVRENNAPTAGGYMGWVYTSGGWKTFGPIAA